MCPACLLLGVDDTGVEEPAAVSGGERIDRYLLIEQIGEGGMGTVWRAKQDEPVEREVALKLIKLGMDTRSVLARFESERQVLALLDHPNTATIFDAGMTASGRPYFVMELVDGVPVTEFCKKHRLDVRGRLELFIQICAAIGHAHQKGVIHRDLKPNNVLVADGNGDPPRLKVIDFGVAKATGNDDLEATLMTQSAQIIGTPGYMSPEQASGEADIDTRADVYSLGALLYEMLAGSPPFDSNTLKKAGFNEILRVIREDEPPKPSTRVTRETFPAPIEPICRPGQLKGDLDWIVMQALAKERQRRYHTVDALREDVRRHLDDEPVSAAAPGFGYRFGKFTRKHRLALLAASAVFLAVLAGGLVATWQAIVAQKASAREKSARIETQTVLADSMVELALNEAEDGDYARAKLWFQKAAETAAHDPARAYANHMRAKTFGALAATPVSSFRTLNHWAVTTSHASEPYLMIRGVNFNPPIYLILDIKRSRQVPLEGASASADWPKILTFHPHHPEVARGTASAVLFNRLPDGELIEGRTIELPAETGIIRAIEYSADAKLIRVVSATGTELLFEESTLQPAAPGTNFSPLPIRDPRLRPDGAARLPISPLRHESFALDARQQEIPEYIRNPQAYLDYGDGTLVVGRRERFLSVWRMPPDTRSWSFKCGRESRPVFHPSGRHVAAYGYYQPEIQIYDVEKRVPAGPAISSAGWFVNSAEFAPDSKHEIALGFGPERAKLRDRGYLQRFDWKSGEPLGERIETPSAPMSIRYHPDGERLFVGCYDGEVLEIQRDGSDLKILFKALQPKSTQDVMHLSADGSTLVVSSLLDQSEIDVWSVLNGEKQLPTIQKFSTRHRVEVRDGLILTTNRRENIPAFFDLETGAPIHISQFIGTDRIYFGHDADTVVTSSSDSFSQVVHWRSGELVCPDLEHGFSGEHQTLAIPHTPWIAVVGHGGARIFDSGSGKLVAPPIHWPRSSGLYFKYGVVSRDGRTLAATGDGAVIQMIDLGDLHYSPEELAAAPSGRELDELSAGASIGAKGLQAIHHNEWMSHWVEFQKAKPLSLTFPAETMHRWHQRNAAELGHAQLAAAEWHRERIK